MLNFLKALVCACAGVALGLAATFFSVESGFGFGAVKAGPWTAWPRSGAPEADPYARAALARSGELPLGLSVGLSFFARADSAGALLSGRCSYEISGVLPAARFWTLTAAGPRGYLVANSAGRYGFTSGEILRRAGGAFVITAAPTVQPGNWLPLGSPERFVLVLRLYDTPVSATASALSAVSLPVIRQTGCA